MASDFARWPEAVEVSTSGPPERTLDIALARTGLGVRNERRRPRPHCGNPSSAEGSECGAVHGQQESA